MRDEIVRVSAIMPVYNVEGFVRRAVESILAQDCEFLELICVDDGSKDGSGAILDELASTDPRLRVIHQANAGAAAARNAAIAVARGEYLYFCDADDWAEPDMLRRMVARADETGAQLVVSGFYIETYSDAEHCVVQHIRRPDAWMDQAAFRRASYDYFDCNLLYPPWNKLYRANYVRDHGLRFRDVRMDDFPFNLDYIRDVERVAVMDAAFYHFTRARADSETTRYYPQMFDKREEEHGWLLELYDFWRIDDEATREFLARRYVERLIGCFENVTGRACPLTGRQQRQAIQQMLASPNVEDSLVRARPRSRMMKLLLLPVRLRCVPWIYAQSKFISLVKRKNVALFARLKASR
ncbi:MAG: glycosyltransferase family 2 protein [Clostridia bacterium]|nr:glycosyltransferase family 2 protein [Clostridia bacterium]